MDRPSASLDFAVIGHQDSWSAIAGFINGIRCDLASLSVEQIKDIYSFIPPRDLFRINVKSLTGAEVNGVFIETFIDPDKLDSRYTRANITKVNGAARHAHKLGARIVALGGFTSIVLEGNVDLFSTSITKFTTGNTLTSAFIVKGIEKAARIQQLDLTDSSMLIIGATGDIGRACTSYFKSKAKKLLLCARNRNRLEKLADELAAENFEAVYSTVLAELVPMADIIICVASSGEIKLEHCKPNVLICDAGYPKNLVGGSTNGVQTRTFHGGMGTINAGYRFIPDYSGSFYRYAAPNIVHGCLLEAIVLAFENKNESYSFGKGNISCEKIEEIYHLSLKNGIMLAPFYDSAGLWKEELFFLG
jgi:fatty aldehyde-generating acyl-ACP reductase